MRWASLLYVSVQRSSEKQRHLHQPTFLGFFHVKRRKGGDEAKLFAGQNGSDANTVLNQPSQKPWDAYPNMQVILPECPDT